MSTDATSGENHPPRRGLAALALMLGAFCAAQTAVQAVRLRAAAPTTAERIYATLVEWGVDTSGLECPVDDAEIRHQVALLRSDFGEVRVRAARWLAVRGVRSAGGEIAASMGDAGTARPCQLAHSLGQLGDERWLGTLVAATKQRQNTDLRTCATIALADLGSPDSLETLIELTGEDATRIFAVRALGRNGDPRALPRLQSLREQAPSPAERRLIDVAIDRIEVLAGDDPLPELLARAELTVRRGSVDEWAIREISRRCDARPVGSLTQLLCDDRCSPRGRELIAAALLRCGDRGEAALRTIRSGDEAAAPAGLTAAAALELCVRADGAGKAANADGQSGAASTAGGPGTL